MGNPISKIKEIVLGKKGKDEVTALTNTLDMVREFSCIGEIIGRDFEIKDPMGKLIYTIHQKPMAIKQLNVLLKEFINLKRLDNERENAKWGTKNKMMGRRK